MSYSKPARAEDWQALLGDLLEYLDMDQAHLRDRLHAGQIIYAGMPEHEVLPEQLAVGGTLMLIEQRPANDIVRAFINTEALAEHAGSRIALLEPRNTPATLQTVSLPEAELAKLTSRRASVRFNLSDIEAQRLRAKTIDPAAAYRAHLQMRFERFYKHGLSGIEPYVRPDKLDDPAREIRAALEGFNFLQAHFPKFHESLSIQPHLQDQGQQVFLLHETGFDGRPMHMLSRQLFEVNENWGIGADTQFYATHGMNSGFVLLGVVPYQQGSLVFALFHIFTNEVLGFGSGLKKSIGRGRATELMTSYFDDVRAKLRTDLQQ